MFGMLWVSVRNHRGRRAITGWSDTGEIKNFVLNAANVRACMCEVYVYGKIEIGERKWRVMTATTITTRAVNQLFAGAKCRRGKHQLKCSQTRAAMIRQTYI